MGNAKSYHMKMLAIDQGVIESLREEMQRLKVYESTRNNGHLYRNPFLIMEIVENIVPYMDFKSQLASRLVCQLWNQISTPIIKPNSHVYLERGRFRQPTTVSEFSELVDGSSVFPLSKVTFALPSSGPSQETYDLFKNHLQDIDELTLIPQQSSGSRLFVDFLNNVLKTSPNLKHLTLFKLDRMCFRGICLAEKGSELPTLKSLKAQLSESWLYSDPHNTLSFLKHFIRRTPNLEKITTDFMYSRRLFVRFFKGVKDSRVCENLVELNLEHARLGDPHLKMLNETSFPKLKSLRIDSLVDNSVRVRFVQLLTSLSLSLEKLVLAGDVGHQKVCYNFHQRCEQGLNIEFPLMKKLKIFENKNVEGFQVGNIRFLEQFPNLEECMLEDFGVWALYRASPWRTLFPEEIDSESPRISFEKMKKLHMKAIFRPYSNNLISLSRMINCFPGLEEFKTMVSMRSDSNGIGNFLSVMSSSGIKELSLGFRDCSVLRNEVEIDDLEEAIKTYLPMFKNLQKLTLEMMDLPMGKKYIIPMKAVTEGFCKVTTLTALSLVGFEFNPPQKSKIVEALSRKLAYLDVRDVDNSFL